MAGTLRIQKQSITEMDVDCIVNAANSQLRHGGGVCGAIFAAAKSAASRLRRFGALPHRRGGHYTRL